MESLLTDFKSRGEDIYSSTAVRLDKRPSEYTTGTSVKSVVEYGRLEGTQSGWGNSHKPKKVTDRQRRSEFKANSQQSHKKSTRKNVVDSEESDDELDTLSSHQGSDGASSVTKTPKAKEGFIHKGEFIPHKASKSVYAGLKFTKTKSLQSSSSQSGPPSSQPSTSQPRSATSKTSPLPQTCPSPPTPVPKSKQRPRPRPIQKTKATTRSGSEPDASSSKVKVDAISVDKDKGHPDSLASERMVKRQPDAFPMSPPTRLPRSRLPQEFPMSLPLTESKVYDNVPRKPAPFVMPSPLSEGKKIASPRAPIPAAFPMSKDKLVGLKIARSTKLDKGKGRANVESDDGDDDDDDDYDIKNIATKKTSGKKKGRVPAPFPMSTQVLTRIADVAPSKAGKRGSPAYSDEDRDSKKPKRNFTSSLDGIHADFDDEGDSILIASTVDPKTLCPFCDSSLPSNPSPLLLRLLAATKEKSSRDPRPSNLLGRKAPLGIFIVVCQRHQFESQILPEAELKGWPKSIDWKRLGSRVRQMKQQLQALINDVDSLPNSDQWDVVYSNSLTKPKKTPRSRCIFWQEILTEVKKKGTRSVTGVQGQFANFEKAQPGYYGELGSAIIQQTLYDLFPPNDVDPAVFTPLTASEFVQRVMVPEVAVRLIMDDQSLDGDKGMGMALIILRESSSYGAAMFPDDSADAGKKKELGLAASEQIVFDRAMKRRKELEEEDLLEEQARQEQEAMAISEQEQGEKKVWKRKTTRAVAQESDAQDSDQPAITAKPRPKPKPVAKLPSTAILDGTVLPERSRSRTTGSEASTDVEVYGVETTAEMSSNDSDVDPPPPRQPSNVQRATSEARRRSPSVSESKAIVIPNPRSVRSAKGSFASLSLSDSSESEHSTKTTTSRKTRSSSRASAAKPPPQKKIPNSSDMDIDSDESMNVENLKTPKPKSKVKAMPCSPIDLNDDTPKLVIRTMGKDTDLPPLERARKRPAAMNVSNPDVKSGSQSGSLQPTFQVNYSKGRGPPVKQLSQDFDWLLVDPEERP